MLYSCETWGHLPNSEYNILEKAQRTIAKYIQGVTRRTHNEIAIGLLGWYTIRSQIDACKLKFVAKLCNMSATCLTKKVFMSQLYQYIFMSDKTKTLTSDYIAVLQKYDLYSYLLMYLKGGHFPDKLAWKHIVKVQVTRIEELSWKTNLQKKNATRYLRVQPTLNINTLYVHIKHNLCIRDKLMGIIYMLTIVENDEIMLCDACNNTLTDSVDHYLMRCCKFSALRNTMWNDLLDTVSVHSEAYLLSMADSDILDILLGKLCPDIFISDQNVEFLTIVGKYILEFLGELGLI